MPIDDGRLSALFEEVGRFYITDRAMRHAQTRFAAALQRGTPTHEEIEAYLRTARRYFTGFAREARAHLADVEKRLARVSQLQFNLSAERGVAARRVAVTQGVLSNLAELEEP
ncbi:MAG: hypothetical protein JO043_08405 [Candidatus Eremiobacteraeota bacterium]|nr:hypothetical protein [Candidatus Eremiobacteraeota bacterium]